MKNTEHAEEFCEAIKKRKGTSKVFVTHVNTRQKTTIVVLSKNKAHSVLYLSLIHI